MAKVARWMFAKLLNTYFGEGEMVLPVTGAKNKLLAFSAKKAWLKANDPSELGVSPEGAQGFCQHVQTCKSPECIQAKSMLDAIYPYYKKGLFPGEGFLSLSVRNYTRYVLGPEEKMAVEKLKPFFEWFQ